MLQMVFPIDYNVVVFLGVPCKRTINATDFIFNIKIAVVNLIRYTNYTVIQVYLQQLKSMAR